MGIPPTARPSGETVGALMFELTLFAKHAGPLSKKIALSDDGKPASDGSACTMSRGIATRVRLPDLHAVAQLIAALKSREAIALGTLREDLPDYAEVTTAVRLRKLNGTATPQLIARTADYITFTQGRVGLALVDYDLKAMPAHVRQRIDTLGGFEVALQSVLLELALVGCVIRASTSAGLYRVDTGERFAASGGMHLYVPVIDAADIGRFLKVLHARCWLAGMGWMMLGAAGQLLERSLVDRSVGSPERLVFEGPPVVVPPLTQDQTARVPVVRPGPALDTRTACLDLTAVEMAEYRRLVVVEAQRLAPEVAVVRAAFIKRHADRIAEHADISKAAAERIVKKQCDGMLLPSVELEFDDPEFVGCTVGDVLANPDRFIGATLADPIDGICYGRCKAKITRRTDGWPFIHSLAHGLSTIYELRYDVVTIEAAMLAADPKDAADVLVELLQHAEINRTQEDYLRELACKRAGLKVRSLAARIKEARSEHARRRAAEEQRRREAERADNRVCMPAPPPDGERLPVLCMLDEVLSKVRDPEPPMRDLDGRPVEVRGRVPLMLHQLTALGANEEEDDTRLPPPELPLVTRHDRYSLAHLIERYVEFVTEAEGDPRCVALPPVFVEHYAAYRDSTLPRVGAVVTAPLVLPNGSLLARQGLYREHKLVFRIDPGLIELLPRPEECSAYAVAGAMGLLLEEWLVDVAADTIGKCVLIAAALSILERTLLPERPAFFLSAGQRGGGKTTTSSMIIAAITGKRPAAAAWSPAAEERRKALLAYLSEGLAALVWDNISRGTSISCPCIEKALTAETYSDRVLGLSEYATVPATTIQFFTGNNIGPRGDMASRSLSVRLAVDRPDPENRFFRHSDPIDWTMANRGRILRALYTILLGNPQLGAPAPPRTRFKLWWHLCGSAVEHALTAANYSGEDGRPIKLDFGSLFLMYEAEDEQANAIATALEILRTNWRDAPFVAADVAKLINEPMAAEADAGRELKHCLDAAGSGAMAAVTAKSVAWRLNAICDAPASVDGQTLTLVKVPVAQTRRSQYRVTTR
jgi:hypothetical protein